MARAQHPGGNGPRESRPRAWVTWIMVAAVVVIAVLPLGIGAADHLEEPFSGADGQAEEAVEEITPGHEPWFDPVFEAPSPEIESGLFALQAAIGAGLIGYFLGVVRTRHRLRRSAGSGAPGDAAPHGPADDSGDTRGPARH